MKRFKIYKIFYFSKASVIYMCALSTASISFVFFLSFTETIHMFFRFLLATKTEYGMTYEILTGRKIRDNEGTR